MIECGWCGHPTQPGQCSYCGRPAQLPWWQRGQEPPSVGEPSTGRPNLEVAEVRRRLADARHALGQHATNAAIAEHLGIAETTVRRWRKVAG